MRANSEKNHKVRLLRIPPTLTAMLLAVGVVGCSILPEMPEMPEMPKMPEMPSLPEMPDWVSPTSWFDELFRGDDKVKAPSNGFLKTEKPFPKLGETPKLKAMTSAEERKRISDSLVADRDNSRYTEEKLRAGDRQTGLVSQAPVPKVKPLYPESRKPSNVILSDKGLTSQSVVRRLPLPSTRIIKDRRSLKRVPSIVKRRGSLPLPPKPVEEVSRGQIPQIVQKPSDAVVIGKTATSKKQSALKKTPSEVTTVVRAPVKTRTALSKEREAPKKTPSEVTTVVRAPVKLRTAISKKQSVPKKMPYEVTTAGRAPVKLRTAISKKREAPDIKPSRMTPVYEAPVELQTGTPKDRVLPENLLPKVAKVETVPAKRLLPKNIQVHLPIGQGQSVLEQTYIASLAAQASPIVSQPGNVFNSPNASPIGGQWSTNVPGVVRQAFNAAISSEGQVILPSAINHSTLISSSKSKNKYSNRLSGDPTLIRFDHGSVRLGGEEKNLLRKLANQAKTSGKKIYVVGHASQRTMDMDYAKHKLVNFSVSLDRANKVANELRRRGVSPENLIVQAKGDSEPRYFEYMPNGEAQNRRVEIFIR